MKTAELLAKCEQTFGLIDRIIAGLKEASPDDLPALVDEIDVDLKLIQATIKDELNDSLPIEQEQWFDTLTGETVSSLEQQETFSRDDVKSLMEIARKPLEQEVERLKNYLEMAMKKHHDTIDQRDQANERIKELEAQLVKVSVEKQALKSNTEIYFSNACAHEFVRIDSTVPYMQCKKCFQRCSENAPSLESSPEQPEQKEHDELIKHLDILILRICQGRQHTDDYKAAWYFICNYKIKHRKNS